MDLTPAEIVAELDRHVIGQENAKRAVAIALRNRWRRQQVAQPLREEITPKNILMIGPTGVGKTEIARRLAKLANAPFIKVEATKFTEVGYVGRDVDSIIRDLADIAIKELRQTEKKRLSAKVQIAVERRILDILLPGSSAENETSPNQTRETLRQRLQKGELDHREIEIEIKSTPPQMEVMGPPGMEEMAEQIKSVFGQISQQRTSQRRVKIEEARKILAEDESEALIVEDELRAHAIKSLEQNGIVFLDEIDKIAVRNESQSADVSRAGVQRDLLPLVEGTTVTTKYGLIKTDHILFIASGAFHLSRPTDLIPELQGRLPIRVELAPLTIADFIQILNHTEACLTEQYRALLATEGVDLEFDPQGIQRIAEISFQVNERDENIGARRLYTVLEKLLENISYSATKGQKFVIDRTYVDQQLENIADDPNLARYIL